MLSLWHEVLISGYSSNPNKLYIYFFWFFETGFLFIVLEAVLELTLIDQAGLNFRDYLPLPPESWDSRCVPPHTQYSHFCLLLSAMVMVLFIERNPKPGRQKYVCVTQLIQTQRQILGFELKMRGGKQLVTGSHSALG